MNNGATIESCMELYRDICKLAVLSNIEIDRSKKEFVINSTTELNILKKKYKITDDEKTVKPWFFKMITTENGFALSDKIKYRYFKTSMDYLQKIIHRRLEITILDFKTSMDYLQKIINKFNFRSGRDQKKDVLPFMSIVKQPTGTIQHSYYYAQRDKIIDLVRLSKEEIKHIYTGYEEMSPEDRLTARAAAGELKQICIDEITKMSSTPSTMYLVLRELDNPELKDVARFVFEVLFGRPDQAFFTMIQESRENVYTIEATPEGDLEYYGYRFAKVPMSTIKN